ncbi:hypothetical protein CcCBS67573_g01559 [Chytriomyces confervae]|uniref:Uncharacterized protein n=1 Tax=Chytriomyces confervae TaxID=246404 RepID=A0A507FNU5_9FUNG|nr:hypothetical protein CcCBS67573_g01559 [Chytriomyces confervae]
MPSWLTTLQLLVSAFVLVSHANALADTYGSNQNARIFNYTLLVDGADLIIPKHAYKTPVALANFFHTQRFQPKPASIETADVVAQRMDQKHKQSDNYLCSKAARRFSPRVQSMETLSRDDGVYDGSNPVPLWKAPSYRVFHKAAETPLAHDVTLFTQLSLDRFSTLLTLVSTWDASISAAIYIESLNQLTDLQKHLESLETFITSDNPHLLENGRTISISLLFGLDFLMLTFSCETPSQLASAPDQDPLHHPYDLLYPINELRNLALQEARTVLVMSLDADFEPSSGMHAQLLQTDGVLEILFDLKRPSAVVLAAFEDVWDSKRDSGKRMLDKPTLVKSCQEGLVVPFHFGVNAITLGKTVKKLPRSVIEWCQGQRIGPPRGVKVTGVQGHTNFTRWFETTATYEIPTVGSTVAVAQIKSQHQKAQLLQNAEDSNLKLLNDNQQPPLPPAAQSGKRVIQVYYEPYFIARRAIVPRFDTTFRGYSFNKRSHSIEMQARGVRFYVAPQVFVLHRWHGESASRKVWKGGEEGIIKKTVGRAYQQFLVGVKRRYEGMWGKKLKGRNSLEDNS